jgi:uncharacterized protein (DUF1499 family)
MACPSSPNCVSSEADDSAHLIAAFALECLPGMHGRLYESRSKIFPAPNPLLKRLSLHAECATAIFGFVDDLELHLRVAEGVIAVRSASLLGYSDLGVNRRRIENLRALLVKQGILRKSS